MPSLDEIRCALAAHAPEVVPEATAHRAAVAMCLCERGGAAEVLFIERARREGDPWSGHMAFPGGRVDRDDRSSRRAAERETFEEVGMSLLGAERLGRLDDMRGHHAAGHPALVISAFVYHVPAPPPLVLSDEVEQAFWFPLAELLDPERHVEYRFGPAREWRYPRHSRRREAGRPAGRGSVAPERDESAHLEVRGVRRHESADRVVLRSVRGGVGDVVAPRSRGGATS